MYMSTVYTCCIRTVAYVLWHAIECHVQLVLCNYTNLQLHVSHVTEFQLQTIVAKPKISSSDMLLMFLFIGHYKLHHICMCNLCECPFLDIAFHSIHVATTSTLYDVNNNTYSKLLISIQTKASMLEML